MEKYKKIVYIGLSILLCVLFSYIFLKYALGILLPFLFSLGIVVISRPLVDKISKATKWRKSVVAVLVVAILLAFFILIISLICTYAVIQIGNVSEKLIEYLSSNNNYITKVLDFLEDLKGKFPFLNGKEENYPGIHEIATEMAVTSLKSITSALTNAVGSFIASLPAIVITIVIITLSLFYFAKDYEKISSYVKSKLPSGLREKMPEIKKDIVLVTIKYLRSYLLLFLITFIELFIGFLIMKIENAFLLSIIIAVVDILPVLGTGIVLVPWSIVMLISGNSTIGLGILLLYAIIYLVRQFIEPKIISSHIEVHPIIAIFSMYAGLKLAGIGGMILAPFLVFLTKTIYKSLKNEKNVEKDLKL